MPKRAKELSAVEVRRIVHPEGVDRPVMHAVGGVPGLYLQTTLGGGASWKLRVVAGTKRRDLGLGSSGAVGLADARQAAREALAKIRAGVDPAAERKAARERLIEEQRRHLTFSQAVERVLAVKSKEMGAKTLGAWSYTLTALAVPVIGAKHVEAITVADVQAVLMQDVMTDGEIEGALWHVRTETATRLRRRIEAVLSWATSAGYRMGDNPAASPGRLKDLIGAPAAKVVHHPAVRIDDMPRWMAALRERDGMGARALEFAALTAARSGEVRGAVWSEIDLDKAVWTIPASRMKMKRDHRVPLPPAAVALLRALPRTGDLVFPAQRGGQLSDMTLSATMRRLHEAGGFTDESTGRPAVPHGLRSSFKDWASEAGFPDQLSEAALAHAVRGETVRAYARSDLFDRRRRMMDAWAAFMGGGLEANVVGLRR